MSHHEKIDYLEFPAADLELSKTFFTQLFDWQFTDYGPEYTAFTNAGVEGGFYRADAASRQSEGGVLVVFFSEDLELTQKKVLEAGGTINRAIFDFPGGRRFHFSDPNNNEFAVWSDVVI